MAVPGWIAGTLVGDIVIRLMNFLAKKFTKEGLLLYLYVGFVVARIALFTSFLAIIIGIFYKIIDLAFQLSSALESFFSDGAVSSNNCIIESVYQLLSSAGFIDGLAGGVFLISNALVLLLSALAYRLMLYANNYANYMFNDFVRIVK